MLARNVEIGRSNEHPIPDKNDYNKLETQIKISIVYLKALNFCLSRREVLNKLIFNMIPQPWKSQHVL